MTIFRRLRRSENRKHRKLQKLKHVDSHTLSLHKIRYLEDEIKVLRDHLEAEQEKSLFWQRKFKEIESYYTKDKQDFHSYEGG